jgi:hypothetical protein
MSKSANYQPSRAVSITEGVVSGTMSTQGANELTPVSISLLSTLDSTLRAWLVSRDELIYCLCSGIDEPVAEIYSASVDLALERVNTLRSIARHFADQMREGTDSTEAVLARAINRLLSQERPRFLLKIDGPGFENCF